MMRNFQGFPVLITRSAQTNSYSRLQGDVSHVIQEKSHETDQVALLSRVISREGEISREGKRR